MVLKVSCHCVCLILKSKSSALTHVLEDCLTAQKTSPLLGLSFWPRMSLLPGRIFKVRSHLVLKGLKGTKCQVNFCGEISLLILSLCRVGISETSCEILNSVCLWAEIHVRPLQVVHLWILCPHTGDNVSVIKLATDSLEGEETMLLMFWLYINEQPGQGALAKTATKWESHQYQSELCTLKVWMMLGERSSLHKGGNRNLFDLG